MADHAVVNVWVLLKWSFRFEICRRAKLTSVISSRATAVTGRLILLCGIAGSGKTTTATHLEQHGAIRMCPDEWLLSLGFDIYDRDARVSVEALQWELTQMLLDRGLTVADESGVWMREDRDRRRTWAHDHGHAVELRFLDAPVDVLTARVEERNRSLPDDGPRIEPGLVAFWNDRIERPDAEEFALFDPPAPLDQQAE